MSNVLSFNEIDNITIVFSEGKLKAVPQPFSGQVTIENFSLEGSELTIKLSNDDEKTVDLSYLVPAIKADRFLSNVTYNQERNSLIFTTSADGEADTIFEVPLNDITDRLTVHISQQEGNAIQNMSDGLFVPMAQGEKGEPGKSAYAIAVENGFIGSEQEWLESLKGETSELDFPLKPYEHNSRLLAVSPNGSTYSFLKDSPYWKDIDLKIISESSELLPNEVTKHHIEITIENTAIYGLDTVDVFIFPKSQLKDIQITSTLGLIQTVINDEGRIKITYFAGRDKVTITGYVLAQDDMTISATVRTRDGVASSDNTVFLNLTHQIPPRVNNGIYQDECPVIEASMGSQTLVNGYAVESISQAVNMGDYWKGHNLIKASTLDGVSLTLNASSVRVFGTKVNVAEHDDIPGVAFIKQVGEGQYDTYSSYSFLSAGNLNASDVIELTHEDYTFDAETSELTFKNTHLTGAYIWVRPLGLGINCQWQTFSLIAGYKSVTHTINSSLLQIEGLEQSLIERSQSKRYADGTPIFSSLRSVGSLSSIAVKSMEGEETVNWATFATSQEGDNEGLVRAYLNEANLTAIENITISLTQGQQYSFKVLSNIPVLPEIQGAVTIKRVPNGHHITVHETATDSDSVYSEHVNIIINLGG